MKTTKENPKEKRKTKIISISIRPKVIQELDSVIGFASRSKVIESFIIDFLKEKKEKGTPAKASPTQNHAQEVLSS